MMERITEQERRAIETFEMPRCTVGLPILWYRNGVKDRTSVEMAYMLTCGSRTAVIHSSSGRRVDAVRHIDDPKLKLNSDQREQGAWDFTDDYKEFHRWKGDISKKLADLEARLAARSTTGAKRGPKPGCEAPPQWTRYQALRRRARELGLQFGRRTKQAELAAMVAEAEAALGQPEKADELQT